MIIRPAVLADQTRILDLALEQAELYPRMRPDTDKMKALIVDSISAPRHYAIVVQEHQVDGVLLAFTSNNAWAQRQNCAVMLWVSKVPGEGATLLRSFRDWVKGRRAIRVAGFAPDVELDPRVWILAERIGFERHGGAYLLYN
jgi:hypothetical protein